jgi:hypothetical protein
MIGSVPYRYQRGRVGRRTTDLENSFPLRHLEAATCTLASLGVYLNNPNMAFTLRNYAGDRGKVVTERNILTNYS